MREGIRFNEDYFERIDTEGKVYWVRLLMADGCVVRTEKDKPYNRIEILFCVILKQFYV